MRKITKDKEGNILSIMEYDDKRREIHYIDSDGCEKWYKYED